jgi:co-chaperonin GroES (HSP10)
MSVLLKPIGISNNLIQVQPTGHLNKIGEWEIFDIHDPAHHFTIKGEVVMVPDRLYHAGDDLREIKQFQESELRGQVSQFVTNRSVEFETIVEPKVGDEVIFRYINHQNCMDKDLYHYQKGFDNPSLFMPYDSLFAIIRDGKMIMINGWIWVKPISYSEEELENEYGVLVNREGEKKIGVGIVDNLGSLCTDYLYDAIGGDIDDVKIGDKIAFHKTAGVSIEIDYHQSLNEGDHPYYIMHRREILNIFKG